jgi:hypothetical protein
MTERKKRELGEVRVFGGVLHARVTIEGNHRESFALRWCKDEVEAKKRSGLLTR